MSRGRGSKKAVIDALLVSSGEPRPEPKGSRDDEQLAVFFGRRLGALEWWLDSCERLVNANSHWASGRSRVFANSAASLRTILVKERYEVAAAKTILPSAPAKSSSDPADYLADINTLRSAVEQMKNEAAKGQWLELYRQLGEVVLLSRSLTPGLEKLYPYKGRWR